MAGGCNISPKSNALTFNLPTRNLLTQLHPSPFTLQLSSFSVHLSSVILLIFVATLPSSVSATNRAM